VVNLVDIVGLERNKDQTLVVQVIVVDMVVTLVLHQHNFMVIHLAVLMVLVKTVVVLVRVGQVEPELLEQDSLQHLVVLAQHIALAVLVVEVAEPQQDILLLIQEMVEAVLVELPQEQMVALV
jgi:hypothetical protein